VSDAGSGSRILRLRRKIPLLFAERSFETVCFDSFILKQALKQKIRSWREVRKSRSVLSVCERISCD
jgi:hypothetical protein